jgi:hypothetical protein
MAKGGAETHRAPARESFDRPVDTDELESSLASASLRRAAVGGSPQTLSLRSSKRRSRSFGSERIAPKTASSRTSG